MTAGMVVGGVVFLVAGLSLIGWSFCMLHLEHVKGLREYRRRMWRRDE